MSFKRKLFGSFGVILSIAVLSVLFAQPALAPISQTKILGATTLESNSLLNHSSYKVIQTTTLDEILATSYLVVDLNTEKIVMEKRPDSALPVASLTKLMTIWTALKYGDKQDVYQIKESDIEKISPNLSLEVGDEVLVDHLISSMIVGSANDAALALSNYTQNKQNGASFTDLMNLEAAKLGMSNSRFSNSTGFDSVANYSSSHDIMLLVTALRSSGIFNGLGRLSSYSFTDQKQKQYTVQATNKLTPKYTDLYAIKTGFTVQALGSMVTTLKAKDTEYLIIVIGSQDREGDTLTIREKLINR